MTFDDAFTRVLGHEGALSLNPRDRGNWTSGRVGAGELKGTKYGVSAAAYPGEDIVGLTIDRAREIYLSDYWLPAGCDLLPAGARFDVFDMAVNSGVRAAVTALQEALSTTKDGVMGPKTMTAAHRMPADRLRARFNGARLRRMTDDVTAWPTFGRGWARRIAENLLV